MPETTRWQRFYLWAGGKRPQDPIDFDAPLPLGHRVADVLIWAGFLMRDPAVSEYDQSWLYHYRWQWRFWRGPYWAVKQRHAVQLFD